MRCETSWRAAARGVSVARHLNAATPPPHLPGPAARRDAHIGERSRCGKRAHADMHVHHALRSGQHRGPVLDGWAVLPARGGGPRADADTGDTIVVPAGTYGVDPTLGAIQLQSPMTITGAGALGTFVDGQGTSGILHLLAGAVASVTGVTLENGETAASGGAALVESGSSLTLSDCALTHNRAAVGGGAIEDQGAVTIQDCTLAANAGPPSAEPSTRQARPTRCCRCPIRPSPATRA